MSMHISRPWGPHVIVAMIMVVLGMGIIADAVTHYHIAASHREQSYAEQHGYPIAAGILTTFSNTLSANDEGVIRPFFQAAFRPHIATRLTGELTMEDGRQLSFECKTGMEYTQKGELFKNYNFRVSVGDTETIWSGIAKLNESKEWSDVTHTPQRRRT